MTKKFEKSGGMDRYFAIERELRHVRNAIYTLDRTRNEFPPEAIIGDPSYWEARLQAIRGVTERYGFPRLKEQADELLVQIATLQREARWIR